MSNEVVELPMVGKIISIDVKVGEEVEEGQQLGIFESMKMEMPLVAPVAGKVLEVHAEVGQVVEAEQPFCTIED
jgi:biotin carboxyl carrier protein